MATMPKRVPKPKTTRSRDTRHTLAVVVQEKLGALGAFSHLLVYREGDHIFIAHRGQPDTPNDADPVLRISHAGQWRFGLSLRRPNGRWEPVPVAGPMFDVIAESVRMFGPWLASRPVICGTSETDY